MAIDLTNPYSVAVSGISGGGTVDYTNPDWYNQFMQNVAGTGNTLAAGPGTPGSIAYNTSNWYSQPLTGQWNPNLQAASTAASGAAGPGGYLTQAGNQLTGAVGGIDASTAALGGVSNNLGGISGNIGQISSTIPGMTTYQPGVLTQFMNPYTNDAANATINLSNKNLFENVLPGVNSTFTGSGQFGSTRNADFENRAIRDNQQTLNNTIGGLNYGAVTNAQNAMKDWANLGLSGVSTQLGAEGQRAGIAGQQMTAAEQEAANAQAKASLAVQGANLGNTNIQNLSNTGASYLDWQNKGLGANYQDYLQQLQYPLTATGALSQVGGMLKGSVQPSQSISPGAMTPQQKAAMLVQLAGTMGSSGTLSDLQALWDGIFGSSGTA